MCDRCTAYRDTHRRPREQRDPEYVSAGVLLYRAKRVELKAKTTPPKAGNE
jgi:hypothetical protein